MRHRILEAIRANTARQQELEKVCRHLDAVIHDSGLLKADLEREIKELKTQHEHDLQLLESKEVANAEA